MGGHWSSEERHWRKPSFQAQETCLSFNQVTSKSPSLEILTDWLQRPWMSPNLQFNQKWSSCIKAKHVNCQIFQQHADSDRTPWRKVATTNESQYLQEHVWLKSGNLDDLTEQLHGWNRFYLLWCFKRPGCSAN
jgi:hypothetical protein